MKDVIRAAIWDVQRIRNEKRGVLGFFADNNHKRGRNLSLSLLISQRKDANMTSEIRREKGGDINLAENVSLTLQF